MRRLVGVVLASALLCCLAAPPAQGACSAKAPSAELRARVKARWRATAAGRARARAVARKRPSRACPPHGHPPPAPLASGGDPAPAGDVAPAPADAVPAPGDAEPVPAPVRSTVGADAYDLGTFVLRLTRVGVPAGTLTIYFRNHDVAVHDLWLAAPDPGAAPIAVSAAVGENGGAAKTVAVTPGAWRLYCSLPGHEAMSAVLAVT